METYSLHKKIPYQPSQEFRYELSQDEFSRKRFETLMAIYKELQATIPEIPISFCLFGSLTKGKILDKETAKDTDIDLDIKFDNEAWKKEYPDGVQSFFCMNIKNFIFNKMDKIKDSLGLEEISLETVHLSITPIDSNSIRKTLSNIEHTEKEYIKNYPKIQIDNSITLSHYFSLSVGEAVKKYRNKFLRELAEMEDTEKASRIWRTIRERVEEVERQYQIPEEARKQFPQTLEEALKFYEVKI